ncbi:ABC transporter permease [Prolixibacteraceae bacterium Z1-6]|uniref:ABC transporter permease n=1 Tax=Draconibacterium aestuarii TaxID=2998507 RepID=A0A9X3J946_9BACT|nr:ABC transporter permease [Prolixibacteraceae bacterium Z1-6]
MNTELFISRRLFFDKANKNLLSQRIIRIALAGIALGLAVMIIAVAVVTGFKNEIRNKVVGFGSHIQIVNYDSNNSYETQAVSENQAFLPLIKTIQGVEHMQVFATKPGMIKTDEYIQGIVFKGVDTDYNWEFFSENLQEGTLPAITDSGRINEILLSEQVAKLLNLKLNDKAVFYFINEKEVIPRMLQLTVCGIYRTGFEEFDKLFIVGDIKQIQRLNNWRENQVTGFEITVDDFFQIDNIEQQIRNTVIQFRDEDSEILRTQNITRQYPQIFDWLSILDMNVWIILILMVMVAGFNMVSGLLVLILDRSTMIGVLKAMGSPNWSIRKVFIYLSVFLTGRGMLWGNVIGVSIIIIQKLFHIIKLDPASYYMEFVPMNFSLLHLLFLNLGTITVTSLILIIPSWFIAKISPEKVIRFD